MNRNFCIIQFAVLFFVLLTLGCEKKEVEEEPPIVPTEIRILNSDFSLLLGSTSQLSYLIKPDAATVTDLKWTSSDPEIATVSDSGVVTAKNIGGVTITLESAAYQISATVQVRVVPIGVSKIEIANGDSLIVAVIGEPKKLNVTFTPENATDKRLWWRSSNTELLTVTDEGIITVKRPGFVFVEAKHDSGIFDSIVILPGTRELGFAVRYLVVYHPHNETRYVHFDCGGITGPVTIHKLWLYTTHGFTHDLKEQIEFEELDVTVPKDQARVVWKKEISESLSNTLSFGSLIEIEYSIEGSERQRLFVTR